MLKYKIIEGPQYLNNSITVHFQLNGVCSYWFAEIANRSKTGTDIDCRIYRASQRGFVISAMPVAIIKKSVVDLAKLLDSIEEFADGE